MHFMLYYIECINGGFLLKIAHLNIPTGAALAPMAGATDNIFRTICSEKYAAFTVSEMVSAKALSMGDKKSLELMRRTDNGIYAIQLFGSEPLVMKQAAIIAMRFKPDFIDLNIGCPAPKIVNNGAGSALMQYPKLVGELVAATIEGCTVPVTVKIRKSYKEFTTAIEVAQQAEKNGAAAVIVHGRTREQMYAPSVDLDIIKQVKEAVKIPVIGNGDVIDIASAQYMLSYTGCDMVMVGRGALGNPWVFEQIYASLNEIPAPPLPTVAEKMQCMLHHIHDLCAQKGEYAAMREARYHATWYMKGLNGAASLRREAVSLTYYTDAQALAERVMRENL